MDEYIEDGDVEQRQQEEQKKQQEYKLQSELRRCQQESAEWKGKYLASEAKSSTLLHQLDRASALLER